MASTTTRFYTYIAAVFLIGLIIGLLVPFRIITISQPAATGAAGTTIRPLKIAFLYLFLANPYFVIMQQGVHQAVNELRAKGIPIELTELDSQVNPSLQISQIESLISKGVDFILLFPAHESVQDTLLKAKQAGIKIITVDSDVPNKNARDLFIGTNNTEGGMIAAQLLVDALQKSGKPTPWKVVLIRGDPGIVNIDYRREGWYIVLQPLINQGKITIVTEQIAQGTRRDTALTVMENILARTKDIDAVLTINDESLLGAYQALTSAGLQPGKDVILVGYDATDDAVKLIKEGKVYGSLAQAPYIEGYWAVYAAFYMFYFNWKPNYPNNNWITTPVVGVTAENADTFKQIVAVPKPLPP